MRLLLDECVPYPLRHDLIGHEVRHVVEMGWSGRRDGDLLDLMHAAHFDALLTVDQNLAFQQNLQRAGIGLVVAVVRRNRLKELRPLVPQILEALATVGPGQVITIGTSLGGLQANGQSTALP